MPSTWDSSQHEPYEKYGAIHQYTIAQGTFALPVAVESEDLAQGTSPVEVVQAHCPYRLRTTVFDAKKALAPPVIPSPESAGAFTFLGGNIMFNQPGFNASLESYNWEAKGEYTFVEKVAHSVSDGFLLMSMPFSEIPERVVTQAGLGNSQIASGAIASAGNYGKAGWELSQDLDFSTGAYTYNVYSYWPGAFFNNQLINGGTPATPFYPAGGDNPNFFPPLPPIE
jgi:hypothetical protein